MREVLIAYHDKCIDGFTSAWVTQRECESKGYDVGLLPMDYTEASYHNLIDRMEAIPMHILYVVDFSLPMDVLRTLGKNHPNMRIMILDHHKTAFENYAPEHEVTSTSKFRRVLFNNVTAILDNSRSGAGICWDYFNPQTIAPAIVRYVQDYDLWKFEYGEDTKAINMYLNFKPRTVISWDAIHFALADGVLFNAALSLGYELLEKREKEIANYANLVRAVTLPHALVLTGGFTFCPGGYVNDVGDAICSNSGADYSLSCDLEQVLSTGLDYNVAWSLRSSKHRNIDVTNIAKLYKGGGHKNAAGFTTTRDLARAMLTEMGVL